MEILRETPWSRIWEQNSVYTDIDNDNKEYKTAKPVEDEMQEKFVQRIHDRFIRNPEFRYRMIENNRDEEFCRKKRRSYPPFDPTRILFLQE